MNQPQACLFYKTTIFLQMIGRGDVYSDVVLRIADRTLFRTRNATVKGPRIPRRSHPLRRNFRVQRLPAPEAASS
jgi:hypothetical protein